MRRLRRVVAALTASMLSLGSRSLKVVANYAPQPLTLFGLGKSGAMCRELQDHEDKMSRFEGNLGRLKLL